MKRPTVKETRASAERVFDYLAETDALPVAICDAVIGFGVFDLTLPRFCGDLYISGCVRRIIFTGGVGAGSADLGQPEADAWCAELLRAHPGIPRGHIILENLSTNTGENVRFTTELLARKHPNLSLGRGIKTVIVVASPSRLRRVRLTLQHRHPQLHILGRHPGASFEEELALYAGKGIDLVAHLAGELDRIVDYAARGWILPEPLPPPIAAAHQVLKWCYGPNGIASARSRRGAPSSRPLTSSR
jgi:hypothetical protein